MDSDEGANIVRYQRGKHALPENSGCKVRVDAAATGNMALRYLPKQMQQL